MIDLDNLRNNFKEVSSNLMKRVLSWTKFYGPLGRKQKALSGKDGIFAGGSK